MWQRYGKFFGNQRGGVDTYIATTICLVILMLFVILSFFLANAYSKYLSMHRIMDMVVDDLKTYGGYTRVTHDSVKNFLERRGFDPDRVKIFATTDSGTPIGAYPLRYGEPVHVVMEYVFSVNILGDKNTYTMRVGSTAVSQFVHGAVPNQCYIDASGGIDAGTDNLPCTQLEDPPLGQPGGTDFLWE